MDCLVSWRGVLVFRERGVVAHVVVEFHDGA